MSTPCRSTARDPRPGKQALRVWLRLLGCANLVEHHVRTRLRGEFDITLPQFDVLAELDAGDGPQTMSGLSRRLMVSNGNVTGVIDRLERAGLVARRASADDRRVHYIELTALGRRRFKAMARAHEQWVGALFEKMAATDRDRLVTLLDGAKRAIQARLATAAPDAD